MTPSTSKRQVAVQVYQRLRAAHPDAHCALDHDGPFQLAVATVLSAQCTDERVNQVTPALFTRFPTPEALAGAAPAEVEALVRPTGFFRNKARNLIGLARALVERHDGKLPAEMDALVALPGVGRKTANVLLGTAFGKNEGVVVDTHVKRLSRRLGWTKHDDPLRVERDLMGPFPKNDWTDLSHVLIFHGRRVCRARTPRCGACPVARRCPSSREDA